MTKIPVTNGRVWRNVFKIIYDKQGDVYSDTVFKIPGDVATIAGSVSLDDLFWLIECANQISIEEEWSHTSISMTKLFNIQKQFANLLKEEK